MDWDEARVQTTEEPFNGGLLVHVFYDGLYINGIYQDGDRWVLLKRRFRTRARAIRVAVRTCHYDCSPEKYAQLVKNEGGNFTLMSGQQHRIVPERSLEG